MINFRKRNNGIFTFLIVAICIALSFSAAINHSYADTLDNKSPAVNKNQIAEFSNEKVSQLTADYNQTREQVNNLNELVQLQDRAIKDISQQLDNLKNNNSSGFEVWTGILLACVAVIVTVLGVVVAILSFVGYREIITKGTEKAEVVAAKQAEKEFEKFISDGRLNDVIAEGINKISFRGIPSGEDLDNDTEQKNDKAV